jgi:hypothetical protein
MSLLIALVRHTEQQFSHFIASNASRELARGAPERISSLVSSVDDALSLRARTAPSLSFRLEIVGDHVNGLERGMEILPALEVGVEIKVFVVSSLGNSLVARVDTLHEDILVEFKAGIALADGVGVLGMLLVVLVRGVQRFVIHGVTIKVHGIIVLGIGGDSGLKGRVLVIQRALPDNFALVVVLPRVVDGQLRVRRLGENGTSVDMVMFPIISRVLPRGGTWNLWIERVFVNNIRVSVVVLLISIMVLPRVVDGQVGVRRLVENGSWVEDRLLVVSTGHGGNLSRNCKRNKAEVVEAEHF